jgi:hypothetical protein
MFHIDEPVIVSAATPEMGPVHGGTRTTVLGNGFRDAATLRCGFINANDISPATAARFLDESQLECSSPVHTSGTVEVRVSANGQQYAPSGVWYTYQSAALLRSISPSSALAEGGTPLTLHGGGFSSSS